MHYWGVKGHARVSLGQPEVKYVRPYNVANATEHYAAAGALVYNIIRNSLFMGLFVCLSGLLLGNGKAHKAQTRWVGEAWSNLRLFKALLGSKVMQGSTRGQNA